MDFKPMMSESVMKYDLTGAQLPSDKFVLTLFGHHDYPPPEPWEYLDKIWMQRSMVESLAILSAL